MKKLLATTALLTMFAATAIAKDNFWYLTFDRSILAQFSEDYVLTNKAKATKDNSLFSNSMYRFGIGVHTLETLRFDLFILQMDALQKNKLDNDKHTNFAMNSMAIMGKISFDLLIGDASTFFVGGSFGCADSKFTNTLSSANTKDIEIIESGNSRGSGASIAWGLNLGFSVPLSDNLDLNIEGSYLRLGHIDLDENGNKLEGNDIISLNMSTISTGFRFYL